jgi:uncharacterized protein (TIGR03437 family)
MTSSAKLALFASGCLLMTLPAAAQTQIGGGACNSGTLNGTYELLLSGRQITAAGAVAKTFEATGTAAFDGQNKITLTMTANIISATQSFGTPLVYTGTYSLQTNCSGSVTITGGDTANFTLNSFAQGNSFSLIGTDSTYAYNGGGNMQPSPCPSTLTGVHAFNATGNTIGGTTVTGILDVAGVLTFDGMGNMTANWSQAANLVSSTISATGTYSVTPACLATATLVDTANNKYSLNFSIYSTSPNFVVEFSSPQSLFAGTGAAAQATSGATCNAASLTGPYEFQLAGRLISTAGNIVKLTQSNGVATFDGVGKATFTITSNTVNTTTSFGTPQVYSGTYTLQSNCQGSISITSGDTAAFNVVAYSVNATTQVARVFALIGTDATYAYNGTGNAQPAACSLNTLSGGWTFSGNGNSLNGAAVTGIVDMGGVFTFDGLGNLTANWNTSSNTTSSSVTATGTYTVSPNCLGTISVTDSTTNTKYSLALSIFGALGANFTFSASSPASVFNGTARTAFVNPGQAVVNAASFTASATPAGSVFTIFGSGLASGVSQASVVPLPTTLLTTSVTVNGELAPLFYVSQTQINAQMPEDIQAGLVTVIVKNGNSSSNAVAVTIPATATPGIVVYGQNQAVVVNQDNSVNAPTNPAKVGDIVVAYLTGGGPVTTTGGAALVTGARSPAGLSPVTGANSITVNGKDATVSYLGLTPGSIGLYQANFKIPQVATGNHPLVITIAGEASNKPLIAVTN